MQYSSSSQLGFRAIPPKLLFSISEASEHCGVSQGTLRLWEKKYGKYLKVERRNNRRIYSADAISKLRQIRVLIEIEGFTSEGVTRYLDKVQVDDTPDTVGRDVSLTSIYDDLKKLRVALDS